MQGHVEATMSCVCDVKVSSTDLPTPVSAPYFLAVVVVGGSKILPTKRAKNSLEKHMLRVQGMVGSGRALWHRNKTEQISA